MKSHTTFGEEMQNIGSRPGFLYTSEEAERQQPPLWIIAEYRFDEVPARPENLADDMPVSDRVLIAPVWEPDIRDDWPRVQGYDGHVMPIETDWVHRPRSPRPDEFITELLRLDVAAAIAVIGAEPSAARQKVATATAKLGTDAFATYLPWHKYANSRQTRWGMWFFLGPLLWWAADLQHAASARGLSLSARDAFNLAFYVAYRHEQFHFHVERFATRQEVLQRVPVYLPYDRKVFSHPKIISTEHWLEEALAQAVVLESAWLYRRVGLQKRLVRSFLEDQFRGFGGAYRDFACTSKGGPEKAHKLLGAHIARAVYVPKTPVTEMATPKREYGASVLSVLNLWV